MSNKKQKIRFSRVIEYSIITIILITAVLLRTYKIFSPIADWHSWRQADTAAVSRIYDEEGINLLMPRYYDISAIQTGHFNPHGLRFVEFPVFNVLHVVSASILPGLGFDAAGRAVSISAAVITTYALYRLGRRISGSASGLAAAFFYAAIPFNVYFTRVVLPDPLSTMLAVLGLWQFIIYYDSETRLNLFLSAILFSLALLVKPFAAFFGLPVAYLALKKYGVRGIFKNVPLLLALDIALIPLLLWRIWIFDRIVGIPHIKWAYNGDDIRFRPSFWKWIFGERVGKLILGIWGITPFVIGILVKGKHAAIVRTMLLGMFLYVSIVATANVRHDYYQTFIVPAVSLTLGVGIIQLWRMETFNRPLRAVFTVFTVCMMLLVGFYEIRENYRINNPQFVTAGMAVATQTPKEALVIAPNNGDTAFLYQTGRRGWPVVNESIEGMIEKGADYYISVNMSDPDTIRLRERFAVIDETSEYVLIDLHSQI